MPPSPIFEIFEAASLSDQMIEAAATLFSSQYGVWRIHAGPPHTPGERVVIGRKRLCQEILPTGGQTSYIRATIEGEPVGNVFATCWNYEEKSICWITQLVVSTPYRRRGIATEMIRQLRQGDRDLYFGVLSSHPGTVLAVSRAAGRSLADIDLEFIKEHSKAITDGSPVRYVKEAMLHGSLWGEVDDGSVSCANTEFYVSHKEPDDALKQIQESGETWPLGALLEGHEFSVVVNVG